MTNRMKFITTLLLLILVSERDTVAQNGVFQISEIRTISIENGKLFIDGKRVPEDRIPESLDLSAYRGATKLSFSGDGGDAYIDLNGSIFSLSGDRLVEVRPDQASEPNSAIFFASTGSDVPFRFFKKGESTFYNMQGKQLSHGSFSNAVVALQEKADVMNRLRVELVEDESAWNHTVVRRLADEAESTARMAMNLTQYDAQSYLQDIKQSDVNLYQRLLKERELELETFRLAEAIRQAHPAQRGDLEKQLQIKLGEAFQFKQENREQEIRQLSQRLDNLRRQVEQREKLKEDIIEARMRELVNGSRK